MSEPEIKIPKAKLWRWLVGGAEILQSKSVVINVGRESYAVLQKRDIIGYVRRGLEIEFTYSDWETVELEMPPEEASVV